MNDTELQDKLIEMLDKLEQAIDYIGPRDLRHSLNEQTVKMRTEIRTYKQKD